MTYENLLCYKDMETRVWYQWELGDEKICKYDFPENIIDDQDKIPEVFYLCFYKPSSFSVDEWKKNYVTLYYKNIDNNIQKEKYYHLYVCKQSHPTIRKNKILKCGSGEEGIILLSEFCRRAGIKYIYIEDEACINTAEGSLLLSDREDVMKGTFSWYLRFFSPLPEMKEFLDKRKELMKPYLVSNPSFKQIQETISRMKNNQIPFPPREFLVISSKVNISLENL